MLLGSKEQKLKRRDGEFLKSFLISEIDLWIWNECFIFDLLISIISPQTAKGIDFLLKAL
uniref:Uncharacterized protein n=1 Tax=Anguilla anguilla TaxID=7936 RepID=A0A0E9WRZ2_ANGAN